MKLIVGLGNPGQEYTSTRHNVGFDVIDCIAKKINVEVSLNKFNGLVYIDGDFILAKPQTFMNLSGSFVQKICEFYKILPQDVIVIYDDLDTPLGQAKIKTSGGSGGHNGIKNIIEVLNDENFARIKIGIGRPQNLKRKIPSYVLGKFPKDERKIVDLVIEKSADAVLSSIYNGLKNVINKFNQKEKNND